MSFSKFGINIGGKKSGQVKVKCPQCSHLRKKNKSEPCLSVNVDSGIFNCHNCGWKGSVYSKSEKKNYVIPTYNNTALSKENFDYIISRKISASTISKHKITQETMFSPKENANVSCLVFNYFRNKSIVNKKYRSRNKGFQMVSGAELILYNIDSIQKDFVIITEGEFDCISFDEAGFHSVVSVPNGASAKNMSYLESCYDIFADVKKIYLATDSDEPGVNLMLELARRLGREKCYIVKYPEECKDANEVLIKYGREELKRCIEKAEIFPIEGVIKANDVLDGIIRLYSNGIDRGAELKELGHEWINLCTFKTSMFYLFTGIPSHGKSTFVNNIEVLLTTNAGWKWGIFSPEHYPLEYLIYKYAEIIVGLPFFKSNFGRMGEGIMLKAIEFIHEHFYFIRPEGDDFTLDKILDIAKQLVFTHGIKGLTIDPWNTIHHNFEGMTETQYIERALNKITSFKQVYDLCVIVVAHPTKIKKDKFGQHEVPSLYDVSSSSHFFNKCDVGITIYRDFEVNQTIAYIQKMKYRNIGMFGRTEFNYNLANNRYHPVNTTFNNNSLLPKDVQSEMPFDDEEKFVFDINNDDDLPF